MVQIPSSERELMATVYLKDGTKVEVPMDELGDYLEANRDNIQSRTIKRRGPVRIVGEITYEQRDNAGWTELKQQ